MCPSSTRPHGPLPATASTLPCKLPGAPDGFVLANLFGPSCTAPLPLALSPGSTFALTSLSSIFLRPLRPTTSPPRPPSPIGISGGCGIPSPTLPGARENASSYPSGVRGWLLSLKLAGTPAARPAGGASFRWLLSSPLRPARPQRRISRGNHRFLASSHLLSCLLYSVSWLRSVRRLPHRDSSCRLHCCGGLPPS